MVTLNDLSCYINHSGTILGSIQSNQSLPQLNTFDLSLVGPVKALESTYNYTPLMALLKQSCHAHFPYVRSEKFTFPLAYISCVDS